MFEVTAYLTRIGIQEQPAPTVETLFTLQRSHLYTVPFENLDIHLGQPIRLDPTSLFDKIVRRRRGGYCFEVNGLFAPFLERLGFEVRRLSASSANDDGTFLNPFDHLALMVRTVDDPETAWLVDTGWGDGPLEPLCLRSWAEQERSGRVFRLRPEAMYFVLEEKLASLDWLIHYRFDLTSHHLDEFEGMNHYLQTSPDSMFTQKRLCTLFRPGGRITLSNLRLIETRGTGLRGTEVKTERILSSEDAYHRVLLETFGLILDR